MLTAVVEDCSACDPCSLEQELDTYVAPANTVPGPVIVMPLPPPVVVVVPPLLQAQEREVSRPMSTGKSV